MIRFFTSVRSRWWALGAAWVAVSLLAFWGLSVVAGEVADAPERIIDRIYILPEFFSRSVSAELGQTDWRLDVARILGPIVSGLTFFQGLAVLFSGRFARLRARRLKGHVIVCGLGEKGRRLATDYLARGDRVVAIELDGSAPGVAGAQRAGAIVLLGDATDPDQLRAAGAPRAKEVVAVCGADGNNAEIADQLRYIVGTRSVPLLCTVHLDDDRLAGQLRLQSLREDIEELRIEFFSIYQGGAAVWIGEHLPPRSSHPDRGPHLVVMGLGRLGKSLVVRAGQQWAESDDAGGHPLRCTVIDRAATGRCEALTLIHPAIADRIALEAIDLDLDEPSAVAMARFSAVLEEQPDAIFVAFDSDEASLSAALLARHGASPGTKIIARTSGGRGLSRLLADEGYGGDLRVEPFPLIDRACRADVIALGVNELLARALHGAYLARPHVSGSAFAVEWDKLPEDVRESNRRQAESVFKSLQAAGFDLIPVRRWVEGDGVIDAQAIERIAESEHERWRSDRTAEGWTYGEVRDNDAKRNPLLRPWKDLTDGEKASARASARHLPHVLARAGFEVVPRPD